MRKGFAREAEVVPPTDPICHPKASIYHEGSIFIGFRLADRMCCGDDRQILIVVFRVLMELVLLPLLFLFGHSLEVDIELHRLTEFQRLPKHRRLVWLGATGDFGEKLHREGHR